MAQDFTKLPKWAQAELRNRDRQIADLSAQLAAARLSGGGPGPFRYARSTDHRLSEEDKAPIVLPQGGFVTLDHLGMDLWIMPRPEGVQITDHGRAGRLGAFSGAGTNGLLIRAVPAEG